MEENSARPYTNSLIKHTEINFDSIPSIIYVKEMPNLRTHSLLINLGFVKFCSLEGKVEGKVESVGKVGLRME